MLYDILFSQSITTTLSDGTLYIHSDQLRYLAWITILVFCLVTGIYLVKKTKLVKYGIGIIVSAGGIAFIVLPGIALESITVSPTNLEYIGGIWFRPSRISLNYNAGTIISEKIKLSKRYSRKNYYWIFESNGMKKRMIPVGDFMMANRSEVLGYLVKHGLTFEGKNSHSYKTLEIGITSGDSTNG